jgi:hypothetical protein
MMAQTLLDAVQSLLEAPRDLLEEEHQFLDQPDYQGLVDSAQKLAAGTDDIVE